MKRLLAILMFMAMVGVAVADDSPQILINSYENIEFIDISKKTTKEDLELIKNIPGVSTASIKDAYSYTVYKGKLFSWKGINEKVKAALVPTKDDIINIVDKPVEDQIEAVYQWDGSKWRYFGTIGETIIIVRMDLKYVE